MYTDKQLWKVFSTACLQTVVLGFFKEKGQDWPDKSFNREKLKVIRIEPIWKNCNVSIWPNTGALKKGLRLATQLTLKEYLLKTSLWRPEVVWLASQQTGNNKSAFENGGKTRWNQNGG